MIKINGKICNFKQYNDGSTRAQCQIPTNHFVNITWLYDNNEELLLLYYLVKHLQEHDVNCIDLEVPYLLNARQDRVKNSSELFTLKYSCNLINSLNLHSIKVYDPHSYVSTALLNKVIIDMPTMEICDILNYHPNAILGFTDEGGYKRYHSYFQMPFIFGIKQRNWETQKIESLQLGGAKHMIAGHDIIICDDILSRGSTLFMMIKALKELGANKIYAWISHCENTVLEPHINGQSLLEIPNFIDRIYTTNSIWRANHPKIQIIRSF